MSKRFFHLLVAIALITFLTISCEATSFTPTVHYDHCRRAVEIMTAMAASTNNLLAQNTGYWDGLKKELKEVGNGTTEAAAEIAAAGHVQDYNVAYYAMLRMAQPLLNAELFDLATTPLSEAEGSFEFCWRICNTLRDPFNLEVFAELPEVPKPACAPHTQGMSSAGTKRLLNAVEQEIHRPVTLDELKPHGGTVIK